MIVYLSGFPFDNKVSKTHERLERILEVPVKHFQYDVTDPVGSLNFLVSQLKKLEEVEEDVLVMGSSLGGFMATMLVHACLIEHLVLFNPSIYPSESLKKYVGKKVTNKTGEIITFTEKHVKLYEKLDIDNAFENIGCLFHGPLYCPGAIIFLTDDPVLDAKKTAKQIRSYHSYKVTENYNLKGHRLDDEKIISIKEELLDYYEYLTVHGL